jgi:hypothetical protein
MELKENKVKVDISFANGLKKAKSSWAFQIFFHFVQFVTMTIMIPIEIIVIKKQAHQD